MAKPQLKRPRLYSLWISLFVAFIVGSQAHASSKCEGAFGGRDKFDAEDISELFRFAEKKLATTNAAEMTRKIVAVANGEGSLGVFSVGVSRQLRAAMQVYRSSQIVAVLAQIPFINEINK